MPAARETDPTPVVTYSSDVSRVESTSTIVVRSRTRGGRSSAAIPDVEMRPEIESRQEPEIDNPAEIQVSMSAICEEGSDATRPYIPEIASQYVTAARPETAAAFPASQESNPNYSPNPTSCLPHTKLHISSVITSNTDLLSALPRFQTVCLLRRFVSTKRSCTK